MSALERAAVQRVVDMALEAGVEVPRAVSSLLLHADASYPAAVFAARFPEGEDPVRHGCPVEATVCCDSASYNGLPACTCWIPEFDTDQAEPVPPTSPADLTVRTRMCGDCAYRPDSPERADGYTAELLLELPGRGEPFYCHDGIRRPVAWRHPALPGVVIPGSPADYQPPMIGGLPFRTNGRPAALCAGWVARAASTGGDA